MSGVACFAEARVAFHEALLKGALTTDEGVPANADKKNGPSVKIAQGIVRRIGEEVQAIKLPGQTAGRQFEEACSKFLQDTFLKLDHLRPGKWQIQRGAAAIARFDQYLHLAVLEKIAEANREVAIALGNDYLIKPDILISREPEDDSVINQTAYLVGDNEALLSTIRRRNNISPILHASVSCKWTLRSDRAQNARSEGLNLVKNRKGRLPHIVVITAEPTPARIASIALGTGEVDCVYHFALRELEAALVELNYSDASDLLSNMIHGKRVRDISDLPLDLAV